MKFMNKYVIVTLKILFFRNVNMDYNSIFRIQIIDETCLLFIYIVLLNIKHMTINKNE